MSRILRIDLASRDAAGAAVVHRFASREYTTAAGADALSGAPALSNIPGRLLQAGLIRRDMFGGGRLRGPMDISSGVVELINSDGALDALRTSYSFDGLQFQIYEISEATWLPIARLRTGYIEQPVFSLEVVTFQVRDVQHALDVELLTTKYAGTNAGAPLAGIEGTAADIAGQAKPVAIGICRNVAPVLVNTSKAIWQVDGVQGFLATYTLTVYDKRAVIAQGAVYVSQADMEATAPAAGTCRVWPAGGAVRFGTTPSRPTVDIDNPPAGAGTSKYTEVLKKLGALRGITIAPYISTTDYACGIWVQDGRTVLDAVNELLQSVNGFITTGVQPNNAVPTEQIWSSHLAATADPTIPYAPTAPAVVLGEGEIARIDQLVEGDATRSLPIWKVNLAYQKNYSVMSASDLAGVALADLAFASQAYRVASASDAAVKTMWPNAIELAVTTLLDTAADAAAEAARVLAMFKVRRHFFSLQVPQGAVRDQLAAAGVASTAYFQLQARVQFSPAFPRFGLANENLVVVGIEENNIDDTYDIAVWG